MAAKVVFSDGSKAMAHNLDDLYERWMARRDELEQIKGQAYSDTGLDTFVPVLREMPETYAETEELYHLLKDKRVYLQERITALKSQRLEGGIDEEAFRQLRSPILAANTRLNVQISALSRHLKTQVQVRQATWKVINKFKDDGKLAAMSVEDKIAWSEAKFTQRAIEHSATEQQISQFDISGEQEAANAKRDAYIASLKSDLVSVQFKLIAAYERIIELQSGSE